jgi:hypothetical protein
MIPEKVVNISVLTNIMVQTWDETTQQYYLHIYAPVRPTSATFTIEIH